MVSGRLQALIDAGLRGMTSNPTIFDKSIGTGTDYDDEIRRLKGEEKTAFAIYDELTTRDIRSAARMFRPVYESTDKIDGYVSLEIDPRLAGNTEESIREGLRLFAKVGERNVMIKVPATPAGFPVVEELLASGVNVNVTLIFSLEQYTRAARAFLKGMKRWAHKGGDLTTVHSVASVFVSRIDTAVDRQLQDTLPGDEARNLMGRSAVANAKLIFGQFGTIFAGGEFRDLQERGARCQRVLWASTGTKNTDYSDVKYLEELIARPTVNTVPEKTLEAFLDHGTVREATLSELDTAWEIMEDLKTRHIDLTEICRRLLDEGVRAFEGSFNSLLSTIENKTRVLCARTRP